MNSLLIKQLKFGKAKGCQCLVYNPIVGQNFFLNLFSQMMAKFRISSWTVNEKEWEKK